jgi:hypothetical protein
MKIKCSNIAGKRLSVGLIVTAIIVIILASPSFANVRETITPYNYAPIYADWYGNDEWMAFIFYRNPVFVPDNFNLLDFYDIPAAFGVPLTVEGFAIFKNPNDLSPLQAEMKGLGAVPIWFISREDYAAAKGDGVLTMPDLEFIPSLIKGSADFYTETLLSERHPAILLKNIEASGMLEDGSKFSLKIIWAGTPSKRTVYLVKITLW